MIHSNGDVPICQNLDVVLGNIHRNSLDEIFNSPKSCKTQCQHSQKCNKCWINYHRKFDIILLRKSRTPTSQTNHRAVVWSLSMDGGSTNDLPTIHTTKTKHRGMKLILPLIRRYKRLRDLHRMNASIPQVTRWSDLATTRFTNFSPPYNI